MDDTNHVAETDANVAMTPSVPKWDSGNSNGTNSKWDSCNLKESNKDSLWDRLAAKMSETNSKDEDKWGSWDTNENKTNTPWNDANKSAETNWEMNTKNNSSMSFSPRQCGSMADNNSKRSQTTSRDDLKWERGGHYDRYSSRRHSSYNGRHHDDNKPWRRTWSDPKTENEGAGSSTLPWNCSKWDTREDSNNKNAAVHFSPNNAQKTSESRDIFARKNEISALIPTGTYVPNSEAFGNDHMKFFGRTSSIEFTEVNKVKGNDINTLSAIDLHMKAKNITHYWPKPIDPDHPQFENQAAVKASYALAQSSSAAGAGKNNESAGTSGTKTVEMNEGKGILMFKSEIADFTKDTLRPYRKRGYVSEEEHNTIVEDVLNKVMPTLGQRVTAEPEKYTDRYIACNGTKLTKLVADCLDKLKPAKMTKMTTKPSDIQ